MVAKMDGKRDTFCMDICLNHLKSKSIEIHFGNCGACDTLSLAPSIHRSFFILCSSIHRVDYLNK